MLKKLIREENIILSTGGGTPCFYDTMTLINEMAISVYLKLSPESLFVRLSQAKKRRPLVINSTPEELRNYITTTLAFREPIYQQAHITVKGESIDIKSLTNKLLDILCKK